MNMNYIIWHSSRRHNILLYISLIPTPRSTYRTERITGYQFRQFSLCHMKGLTSWLSFVMINCVFVTFPRGILGQVWYLIVLIPGLCHLSYFYATVIYNHAPCPLLGLVNSGDIGVLLFKVLVYAPHCGDFFVNFHVKLHVP